MRKNSYTQAFRDFEKSHHRSKVLFRIEVANYKDPPPPRDQAAIDAIRSGATILLVASIEQYIKSAMEEAIEELGRVALVTSHANLPPGFNEHNDFRYIQAIIRGRKNNAFKTEEIRRVAALISSYKFIPESFSQTQSNPGSKTVGELLREFGIKNPFATIERYMSSYAMGPVAAGFASSTLDDLVNARNQVAHGQYSLSKSRLDIKKWIEFSYIFGKSCDNTIRDRVLEVIAAL